MAVNRSIVEFKDHGRFIKGQRQSQKKGILVLKIRVDAIERVPSRFEQLRILSIYIPNSTIIKLMAKWRNGSARIIPRPSVRLRP